MVKLLLVLALLQAVCPSVWLQDLDEKSAQQYVELHNEESMKVYFTSTSASWNYQSNLTDHNQKISLEKSLQTAAFDRQAGQNASLWDWRNFKNETLKRIFQKIADIGTAALPDDKLRRVNGLRAEMVKIYSEAKVCGNPRDEDKSKCYQLEPGLSEIMANSRDYKELLWAWHGWRNQSGRVLKPKYEPFTELQNEAARLNGYPDNGAYWRSSYEMEDLEKETARLWEQIKPLYANLHAYVKRKLQEVYSDHPFPSSGHIPAHLFGNMWAQTWGGVASVVRPYPNKTSVDVSDELKRQGYNSTSIFQLAEEFFTSLGLIEMPDLFWKHSILKKPTDRNIVCHASAWDFMNRKDFRIKQCTEINMHHMIVAHHEMGHIEYDLQYKHHVTKFRSGANPGFHEAIGDVLALSVSTPEHLHKIGLLEKVENDAEADINFLLSQALKKLAFLPFGYLIDQWRWSVFRGVTTPQDYNGDWWKLRCKLQGISAPVSRSEEDFDPGAKYHVPANTPYIRYFVSHVIQFQMHKSLCEAANNKRALHRCDIYQSKAAGDKIGDMMKLGASRQWADALEAVAGTRKMDAGPLMEYFKPLTDWLAKENEGHDLTWTDECPDL